MTFEEFGTEHEKTMMLLPGTCCDWQINFRNVFSRLYDITNCGDILAPQTDFS